MSASATQGGHKKLKPGLAASYNIQPGNGEGLFLFWHLINLSLTYLLRHLPTYLQPRDPHGAPLTWVPNTCGVGNISDVQPITYHISEDRNSYYRRWIGCRMCSTKWWHNPNHPKSPHFEILGNWLLGEGMLHPLCCSYLIYTTDMQENLMLCGTKPTTTL